MNSSFKYDIFISFVSEDMEFFVKGRRVSLVEELKKTLESFRHPAENHFSLGKRLRVCTYHEDFEIPRDSPTVESAIRRKIAESKTLLVISSKGCPSSHYVKFETEQFRLLRTNGSLISAVWDVKPDEVLPEVFQEGVLGADLSCQGTTSLKDWRRKLRRESAKIISRASEVPLETIEDRFRKDKSRLLLLISIIPVLTVLSFVGYYITENTSIGYHATMSIDGWVEPIFLSNRTHVRWEKDDLEDNVELKVCSIDNSQSQEKITIDDFPIQSGVIDMEAFDEHRVLIKDFSGILLCDTLTAKSKRLYLCEFLVPGLSTNGSKIAFLDGEELLVGDLGGEFSQVPTPPQFQGTGHAFSYPVEISPDGRWIVTYVHGGKLAMIDAQNLELLDKNNIYINDNHECPIDTALYFHSGGNSLFFISDGGIVVSYNIETRSLDEFTSFQSSASIYDFEFSKSGRRLFLTSDLGLHAFEYEQKQFWSIGYEHVPGGLGRLSVSPTGDMIIASSGGRESDWIVFERTLRSFGKHIVKLQ